MPTDIPQEIEAQRLVGTVLGGKWTLDSLIGMGGMASVYAATHRNGRRAAIKLLSPEYSRMPQVRDRFLREGYVANRIGHPGVVSILDDDTTESGQVFLVMELLEGDSFLESHQSHSLTPAQVVFIGEQVLEPLAAAHRRGIIHRDIKPGNIFVCSDGRVKVLDFGLARVLEGNDLEPTRDGLVLGTVPYLSPEQARAKRDAIDWRSDIYGVGAMLFYALSGHYVHEANSQLDMLMATIKHPARSLTIGAARRVPQGRHAGRSRPQVRSHRALAVRRGHGRGGAIGVPGAHRGRHSGDRAKRSRWQEGMGTGRRQPNE